MKTTTTHTYKQFVCTFKFSFYSVQLWHLVEGPLNSNQY